MKLTARRPTFRPLNGFAIEAAKRGAISRLTVEDSWEQVYQGEKVGSHRLVIPAEDLANDLVNEWRTGTHHNLITDRAKCGVWVHPGASELTDEAIMGSGMYHNAVSEQEPFARFYINQADIFQSDPKTVGGINEMHRALAEWMGVTDRAAHPWIRVQTANESMSCPMCGSSVKTGVAKCAACNHIVNPEFFERLMAAQSELLAKLVPTPTFTLPSQQAPPPPKAQKSA